MLMSVVYLKNFVRGGMHGYTESCNRIAGYEGIEFFIATVTSIYFWILVLPMIYEIANILIPGIPRNIENFDKIDHGKDDFKTWYGLHRWLKLFSYISPDIIWASLASEYIQGLPSDIPNRPGFYDLPIGEAHALEISHAHDQKRKLVASANIPTSGGQDLNTTMNPIQQNATTAATTTTNEQDTQRGHYNNSVFTDDDPKRSSRLIVAVERPLHPNYQVDVSPVDGYIAVSKCSKIVRDTKIWNNIYIDKAITGEKYVLLKIHIATGYLEFIETYDIHTDGLHCDGRGAHHLAQELAKTSNKYLVVVATTGDTKLNHLHNNLPQEMYRCGASEEEFSAGPLRGGYLMIGVPGYGKSNGFEAKPSATNNTNIIEELHLDFNVVPTGDHRWKINESISSGRNFQRSMLAERTLNETHEWNMHQANRMPTFWSLCQKEHDTLIYHLGSSNIAKIISLFLVISNLGHFITSVGRRAMWCTGWKYLRFLQVSVGWWTDQMVEMYFLHEMVHETSCVWDDPFVKLEIMDSEVERIEGAHLAASTAENNVDNDDKTAKISNHRNKRTNLLKVIENQEQLKSQHNANLYEPYEKRKKLLKEIECQEQLKRDYSTSLYALLAPRAAFFQLIPYASFLSIFVSFTASSPIFVKSKNLQDNLHDPISKDTYKCYYANEVEFNERLWKIRQSEVTNAQSYNIELKGTEDEYTKSEILKKNKISQDRLKLIIDEEKPPTDKWTSYLCTPSMYLNESRYISFIKGLFKTCIAISLSFSEEGDTWPKYVAFASVVVLIPFALADSLTLFVDLGTVLGIRDEELYQELGWIIRTWNFICCYCSSNSSSNSSGSGTSAGSGTNKDGDVELKNMHSRSTGPTPTGDERVSVGFVNMNPLQRQQVSDANNDTIPSATSPAVESDEIPGATTNHRNL
jgi:hypothetical protein